MELAHNLLYILCEIIDMMAAFQAMVSAHYKIAAIGILSFIVVVLLGATLYFSEGKRK